MLSEEQYIKNRQKQAKKLTLKFKLMQVFPIKRKKIVVSTFEGDGGYCCNPRYIIEELLNRSSNYEIVWLTHDISRQFPEKIKVVKDTSWNIAYHLSTAHIWLDNYRKPLGTIKRKGQIYIQTWHASIGFKAVGLYRGDLFPKIARIVSKADSDMIDYMIINSDYCERVYPKKLLYDGKMLKVGSPRVDCLINKKEELHKLVRRQYDIGEDVKLLLFAPTFRGGNQSGKKEVTNDIPSIDFEKVLNALFEKTGDKWKVLLRLHPQVSAKISEMPLLEKNENYIDVSQEPDISEIMGGCDLVITDYSSCAFDALFAYIPVLLYADDVQEYIANRGKFMWEKEELPFLMAETNDELIKNIKLFCSDKYNLKIESFVKMHGIKEIGCASKMVVDKIDILLA